jgi:hypothetical protein
MRRNRPRQEDSKFKRRLVALSIAVGLSIPLALSVKPGGLRAASAYKDSETMEPHPGQRAGTAPQKGKADTATERRLPKTFANSRENLVPAHLRKPSPMRTTVQPGTGNVLHAR